MSSFEIQYSSEDTESLARNTTLIVRKKKSMCPNHATTVKDIEIFQSYANREHPNNNINLSFENLSYDTLYSISKSLDSIKNLQVRLQKKTVKTGKTINIIYPRISKNLTINKVQQPQTNINDFQISGLVGAEIDAGTDIVVPPMPGGVNERKVIEKVIERTKNEILTFNSQIPMMAYIPKTDDPGLATYMVKEYLRQDKECRIFGIDFSGSSYPQSLIRAVVRTIRDNLKIKGNSEKDEKYYLHAFNVSGNRKSRMGITPMTDIIIHMYGIDTTSGVIYGGGKIDLEKCRYAVAEDYGAYKKSAIEKHGTTCQCPVCKKFTIAEIFKNTSTVLDKLKVHRMIVQRQEFNKFYEKIGEGDVTKSYVPYLRSKQQAEKDVEKIMKDVKEIKAR
jgi:hypothetical protein